MTSPAIVASADLATLAAAARAAGLTVSSSACLPQSLADGDPTPLAGFIESDFSPLVAEVARRVLRGRDGLSSGVIGIVIVTALGDVTSATRVAEAVDAGRRVAPLLFFQSVPNSVAGYLAAKWHLTGPVVCVTGTSAGLDVAAQLIGDADAEEVLVVRVELRVTDGVGDRAAAVLVTGPAEVERPGIA